MVPSYHYLSVVYLALHFSRCLCNRKESTGTYWVNSLTGAPIGKLYITGCHLNSADVEEVFAVLTETVFRWLVDIFKVFRQGRSGE